LRSSSCNDHDTAIKIYDKIQTIKPTYVPAVYNKGVTLLNQENYKSAISEFKKALILDPNDPTILTNLGNAYAKSGDT
jgi:tetratricopeptide (TPR) repeat protein